MGASSPPIGWALTQKTPPDQGGDGGTADSGTMCGSLLGLALVQVPPVVLVLGLMSAGGAFPPIVPVMGGIGMLIAAALIRPFFRLTVKSDRLEFRVMQQKSDWYWQNVDHIESHRFGATLVLKQPVDCGRMMTNKVRIAYLDSHWRDRPIMQTVARRVALQQAADEAASRPK